MIGTQQLSTNFERRPSQPGSSPGGILSSDSWLVSGDGDDGDDGDDDHDVVVAAVAVVVVVAAAAVVAVMGLMRFHLKFQKQNI